MVSEVLDNPELLQTIVQGFLQGFHCVNQSGFKGPDVC